MNEEHRAHDQKREGFEIVHDLLAVRTRRARCSRRWYLDVRAAIRPVIASSSVRA